ncbi:MAG TPA: peptidylprolyl isomerase, partial [Wenzhouxiangella sp.]
VDRALEQLAGQNQMTLTQLRSAMEGDGMDFDEFRNQIRHEIVANELRRRVGSSVDNVTETDVDILLASDQFGGQEYDLSQIALALSETASPAEAAEAEAKAREVLAEIEGGLDFSSAAITYSQSADALEGGNVGWRSLTEMPPVFADVVQDMGPGDVSDLIRSPNGFIILKVNDIREQQPVIVQEYQARHIMIEPNELMSREEAQARVNDLRAQILAGEDFADLARRFSNDESSSNIGGLLNWFPENALGPAFQQEIDALEVGGVEVALSEPFQSPMGWHLLLLEDVRQVDRTEEATRDQARNILFNRRAEEEVESFLRQLRSEAFVETRLQ